MGWEAGLFVSFALLVIFSPIIAGAYLLIRWPVRRVVGEEHPVLRRVLAVAILIALGKVVFSLPQ